jgi:hypothetical protein
VGTHRVITVERQFVADGANSLWSVCVSYVDGEARPSAEKRQRRIDYREILSPNEFAIFAKLRALRKEMAEREGVPFYALFTNPTLWAGSMVTQAAREESDLFIRITKVHHLKFG